MSAQETLKECWLGGVEDRLCAREQAKAWALREVWLEDKESTYGLYEFVAKRVRKTKNGKPKGAHPNGESIREFFQKVDCDSEWFPGKHNDKKRGPKRILVGPKKSAIAAAAKRIKIEVGEPTYSAVVAACPKAKLNPDTNEPVSKQMTAWKVADVAEFLRSSDLAGAASVCEANDINGRDLLAATKETMIGPIRITEFAAAKILAARDAFLVT